jgi:hypothetical protein
MSEITVQEGEFKMPKPKKPRNLNKEDSVTKVDISKPLVEQDITKVTIQTTNSDPDAIQIQSTDESVLRTEQPEVGLQEMEQGDQGTIENVIEEITNQEIVVDIKEELKESVQEQIKTGKPLPENIEKLVSFMEETGGTVEDYVRLNTDYSTVNEDVLIREYYKSTKPHLDLEEIQFLMEDTFFFDEDLEEERDIRKKKLAYKEEVVKAKNYLESVKSKYYEEIKLRPGTTQEQREASEFFNRYKKNEDESKMRHDRFKQATKNLFNDEFKGFEYNVGDKRFRYGIQNTEQVAEKQSDISNFIGKFLDKEGNVSDTKNYHKALYTAMNSDKIAQHFYEQGRADAVKEVVANSKNPSLSQPRQTSGEVFINGLRVKSVSGFDSSKLKIQTKKFNN